MLFSGICFVYRSFFFSRLCIINTIGLGNNPCGTLAVRASFIDVHSNNLEKIRLHKVKELCRKVEMKWFMQKNVMVNHAHLSAGS